MSTQENILIIDDDLDICTLLQSYLSKKGFFVEVKHSGNDGLRELSKNKYDLLITDYRLPDQTGMELLKSAKNLYPEIGVIVITGYSDIRMAVEVIKFGAFDYVTKPLYPEELLNTVKDALRSGKEKTEEKSTPKKSSPNSRSSDSSATRQNYIIGENARSKVVYENMKLVAPTDMSVLIRGETGTGKEWVAKEIHRLSKRSDNPFVAIDCGALPKDIAGSEFFGHEKGAFTGALASRDGRFKLADGGTLFLDEIGNLSYEVQLKLLRVLQERKFTRIGGTKDISVDVRILAATNDDLRKAVEEGEFREDLYYRLNEFQLTLSPLRNRNEDLDAFVDLFLAKANDDLGKEVKGLSPEVKEKFKEYTWPGNLRELKNVIKRAVLLTKDEVISISAIPNEISMGSAVSNGSHREGDLKTAAKEAERKRIVDALEETGNNKSKAARLLNIDRKTLYNKLKELNISA